MTEPARVLGDDTILSNSEFREMLGVSRATIHRLDQSGEGPPKIRLSERRVGRRLGDVRSWLQARQRGSS